MREGSWDECMETGSVLEATRESFKIRSLVETARGRVKYLEGNRKTEDNANYLFEGYYTSVLEMLHAVLLSDGYKVSNHVCAGYYLRDVLKREDMFRDFNDLRFKRNSLTYYGRRMDFRKAGESIRKSLLLMQKLGQILDHKPGK